MNIKLRNAYLAILVFGIFMGLVAEATPAPLAYKLEDGTVRFYSVGSRTPLVPKKIKGLLLAEDVPDRGTRFTDTADFQIIPYPEISVESDLSDLEFFQEHIVSTFGNADFESHYDYVPIFRPVVGTNQFEIGLAIRISGFDVSGYAIDHGAPVELSIPPNIHFSMDRILTRVIDDIFAERETWRNGVPIVRNSKADERANSNSFSVQSLISGKISVDDLVGAIVEGAMPIQGRVDLFTRREWGRLPAIEREVEIRGQKMKDYERHNLVTRTFKIDLKATPPELLYTIFEGLRGELRIVAGCRKVLEEKRRRRN